MQVNFDINVLGAIDKTAKAQKNLVYSVVQGINATAKKIQEAQQQQLEKRFTLRSNTKAFMLRNVAIIKPFASVGAGRLFAEVGVGQRNRLLLGGYETGEERKPFKGHMIAQPVVGSPARPTFGQPVQPQFTFRAMALKAAKGKQAANRKVGNNGTYSVRGVGVFQRTGPGREGSKLLYGFARQQRLPAKLNWQKTARDIAAKWLNEYTTQAFLKSLNRSKP